jgi:hypothetical protein
MRLDDTLPGHPKVRRLARTLDVPQATAIGYLVIWWTWVLRYRPDGELTGLEPEELEDGAGWEGAPGHLARALERAGLLDRTPDGRLQVHDWHHYAGSLREAERKARQRRASTAPSDSPGTMSRDCPATVPGLSQDCPATVLADRTGQDRTRQDETDPDESSVVPELTLVQAEPATLEPPDVVLTFPAVGRGPAAWHLTERLLEELHRAYPDLDCRAECRRALAWVQASPRRRKTARGYQAFITAWLQRSQERPGGPIAARAGPSHPPKTQANLDTMRRWLERHAEDR